MIATVVGIALGLVVMGAFAYVLLNPNVLSSIEFMSILPTIEFPQDIVPQPALVDIPTPAPATSKTSEVPRLDILDPEMYTHYASRFTVQNTGMESITVNAVSYGAENTISGLNLLLASGQKREIAMSNLNGTAGQNYLLRVNGTSVSTGTQVVSEKIVLLTEPVSNLEIMEAHVTRSVGELPTLTLMLRNSGMTTITISEIWLTKSVDKSLWDPVGGGITLKPNAQKTLEIPLDSNDYITSRVETSQRSVTLVMLSEITLQVVGKTDFGRTVTESTIIPIETAQKEQVNQPASGTTYLSLDQYRDYLLSLINNDRADYGLEPVRLSDNKAAQSHAYDMLETRKLSHWTSDGMKPYMRYSIYDGTDAVSQNAAKADYLQSAISKCESGEYLCAPVDVKKALEELQYIMMYDDYECCNNGHRHNILDPHHTHVSIGIAYDKYGVYIVQNFENNYLSLDKPKVDTSGTVILSGKVLSKGEDLSFDYILVYYDEMPTPQTYVTNVDRTSYDAGQFVGGVVPPTGNGCASQSGSNGGGSLTDLLSGSFSLLSCKIVSSSGQPYVQASEWDVSGNDIRMTFGISDFVKDEGSGVYTLYLMASSDGGSDGDSFRVTSYSIFVK